MKSKFLKIIKMFKKMCNKLLNRISKLKILSIHHKSNRLIKKKINMMKIDKIIKFMMISISKRTNFKNEKNLIINN